MDPDFPARLFEWSDSDHMLSCFMSLFSDYSRRNITQYTDRPIAISGLEDRMKKALRCDSRYCTFDKHLHRGLLWDPATAGTKTSDESHIPSWSWLSHPGGVRIWGGAHEGLLYAFNDNLSFNPLRTDAIDVDLGVFFGCEAEVKDDCCILRATIGAGGEVLRFDVRDTEALDNLHCVVIAKVRHTIEGRQAHGNDSRELYAVLMVVPTGMQDEYRRVGIGKVPIDWVIKVQDKIQLV